MNCNKCGKDVKECKVIKDKEICFTCYSTILEEENIKLKAAFNEIYRGLSTLQLRGFKIMLGESEDDK